MRIISRIVFPAVLMLLLAVACDTKEDAFYVGDEPKEIISVDKNSLLFTADSATYEISVTSIVSWEVTINNNNKRQFEVSPTSGRGNGVIKVKAKSNGSKEVVEANLSISPLNFDMEPLTVSLSQGGMEFEIKSPASSRVTPEEGDTVGMKFVSTIDWVIEVGKADSETEKGNLDWLTITPGMEGAGSNQLREFVAKWKPNYTRSRRSITLELKPKNSGVSLVQSPAPFTLVQEAGTLPMNVRCNIDQLRVVDVDLTIDYSSRSPVKDCGAIVISGTDTVGTYRPEAVTEDGTMPKSGPLSLTIPELKENTGFRIVPFVLSEVGRVEGSPQEVVTEIKPENRVYEGVRIIDADSGGVSVETDLTSATITLTATTDVPVENPIAGAVLSFNGMSVNGHATLNADNSRTYVFMTADTGKELVPNTEYDYSIVLKSEAMTVGTVTNMEARKDGKFKTKGITPNQDDNNNPIVGE